MQHYSTVSWGHDCSEIGTMILSPMSSLSATFQAGWQSPFTMEEEVQGVCTGSPQGDNVQWSPNKWCGAPRMVVLLGINSRQRSVPTILLCSIWRHRRVFAHNQGVSRRPRIYIASAATHLWVTAYHVALSRAYSSRLSLLQFSGHTWRGYQQSMKMSALTRNQWEHWSIPSKQ